MMQNLKWMNEYRRFHFWLNQHNGEHADMHSEDYLAFVNVMPLTDKIWKNCRSNSTIPRADIEHKLEYRKSRTSQRVIDHALKKVRKSKKEISRFELIYFLMKGWLNHSLALPLS